MLMPAARPWFSVSEEMNMPTATSAAPITKMANSDPYEVGRYTSPNCAKISG